MGSSLQETFWVFRSQLGDDDAFMELIKLYHCKLSFFIRHMGVLETDREDILQEVWLTVFRKIRHLKEPERFCAWIYTIARNKIKLSFRKAGHKALALEEKDLENLIDRSNTNSIKSDAVAIYKTIEELKPIYRDVIILFFLENMSYRTIAEVIGCSEGTVKSRLHYAKVALRQKLENNQK